MRKTPLGFQFVPRAGPGPSSEGFETNGSC